MVSNVWVAADRLDADTNRNFSSWAQYFGPHEFNGDFFSTVERDNISSLIVDAAELGEQIDGSSVDNTIPQFYNPQNIAILTDGVCASTCAVFVEIMHHGAGVRTIVAGGLPHTGPMQAVGGTRGDQVYSSDILDYNIAAVELLNETTNALLPNRSVDMLISAFQVNIRDQMRQNVETPVQFLYDAADCRIYFTAETWKNYTALWTYASNAIFGNDALCVPGSTGYATSVGSDSTFAAPPPNPNPALRNSMDAFDPARFTNSTDNNFEEGRFHPEPVGQEQVKAPSIPCDNLHNPCRVGTCNYENIVRSPGYDGREVDVLVGTCSEASDAPASGDVHDLLTYSDQPPEVNGDANRHHDDDTKRNPMAKLIMAGFSKRSLRWLRR